MLRAIDVPLLDAKHDGALEDVVITTEYRPGTILHDKVNLLAQVEGGEAIEINGAVLSVCPTKIPMRGGATFVNEGLTEVFKAYLPPRTVLSAEYPAAGADRMDCMLRMIAAM